MEISAAISDSSASLALARALLPRASASASATTISALASGILPVRSRPAAPHALLLRARRTRRRPPTEDGGEDGFSGDGDGDDGPFGGGGRGWGLGRGGGGGDGSGWEGSGSPQPSHSSDPAFDFVYEVICWMALSNCTHFAFRRLGRLLAGRGKVMPVRLVPSVC